MLTDSSYHRLLHVNVGSRTKHHFNYADMLQYPLEPGIQSLQRTYIC